MPAKQPLLSSYLDAVRFLAAMAVVLGHARLHVFGPTEPGRLSPALKVTYLTGEFSHIAVIIFFVISGYLVGGKLYSAAKPQFVTKYLLDRATRIYIVAIPMLTFGFATMLIQQGLFGYATMPKGTICDGTIGQLAGSMLFIHRGFVETPCFNGPFWSLIYEVFYYLFFLAIAVAVTGSGRTRLWAIFAAVALGIYGLLEPAEMLAYSTMWLIGMAAAHQTPLKGRQLLFTAAIIFLLCLQAVLRMDNPEAKWEVPVSLVMAGSFLLLRGQAFQVPERVSSWFAIGASMSYSLYLAHVPAMNLLRGIADVSFGARLGVSLSQGTSLAWYALFVATGFLAGLACWWLFERHTMLIRTVIERRSGITRPEARQSIPTNAPSEGEARLPPRNATQPR